MSSDSNQINEALESAEAILENVFGESLEISPNLNNPPENKADKKPIVKSKKKKEKTSPPAPALQINTEEPESTESTQQQEYSFADLPLSDAVKNAVKEAGYQAPTPIQAKIIPHLLFGRDVVAQSQTGSGKTAAFALPILTRIETECREPQVLILVPTRELAIQVGKSFEVYGQNLDGFNHAVIYGGQDYEIQYRQLRKGPQVIVGTPGRVIDHIKNKKLDVSEIECLVLDEADEMLNMGFLDDIHFVLEHAPKERQIALFSATLPEPIRKISERYLNDPAKVTIKQKTLTADSIRQRAVLTSPRDRIEILIRFLEAEEADGAIVFTRTRETTTVVADRLTRAGLRAIALNGEMPQRARERTIEKLKAGQLDILVATDIAARGLDVSRISHVFNYDLPEGPEAYTHRVGRTGRAGKKGEAVIFLTRSQQGKLKFIEKITRQKIEIVDPPAADAINKMRIKRFYAEIDNTIANRDMHFFKKLVGDYIEQSEHPVELIAAAIAMNGQKGQDFLMKERQLRSDDKPGRKNSKSRSDKRFDAPPEPGMARFRIAVGKRDGVRPGNIVGAVANEADIDGDKIGSIRIYHSHSTIDLPSEKTDKILQDLSDSRVSGRPMRIKPYDEREDHRPGRRSKPTRGGSNAAGKRRSSPKSKRSNSVPKRKSKPFKGKKSRR